MFKCHNILQSVVSLPEYYRLLQNLEVPQKIQNTTDKTSDRHHAYNKTLMVIKLQ